MNDEARKMAEEIRRMVPRPGEGLVPMPAYVIYGESIPGIPRLAIRFRESRNGKIRHYCPMGFLPGALDKTPSGCAAFSPSSPYWEFEWDPPIRNFAAWWDSQVNPKLAMDEVWGPA